MRILVTGGAGFVGSSLARFFKRHFEAAEITAFDNLKRRGSELNLPELKALGIQFIHGDIRIPSDFLQLNGDFDLIIDASAEPSVHAGTLDAPDHVFGANLTGTFNCLNFARTRSDAFLFLSTSRVYSMAPLRALELTTTSTRFEMIPAEGIAEDFPTNTARSLYGATKLSSEMLVQEFVAMYGMKAIIYRCGVIAGPGQFGKPDQGVFTLWLVRHYFRKPLQYIGFGGEGKQVRDLLHPLDLADLIAVHLPLFGEHRGRVFNVGGGRPISVSLLELTEICRRLTGNVVQIGSIAETSPVDIPVFITDTRRIRQAVRWEPRRDVETILGDTLEWVRNNETQLERLFFLIGIQLTKYAYMKLSVVIPAHNEAGSIISTLRNLDEQLRAAGIDHEIIVVNDHSYDETELLLRDMSREYRTIRYVDNVHAPGFGLAVRAGLEQFTGDAVAVYMADASDRPEDLIAFYERMLIDNVDCVFGSRFIPGAKVVDYPGPKLLLNRLANAFIRIVFGLHYNDITNAFKLYRREVIEGVQPLLSHHFNLTVELPLKAMVRGYSYSVVPNYWINRKSGESKLKIKEMGSRYLFIVLYCFIEKWLSRGDYHRKMSRRRETVA